MGQANSRSELLWQMSGYGNRAKVKEILGEGLADPNWVSLDDNSTAIMVAAGSNKGDAELIRLLLSAGADVTRLDNRGNSALHHAAMRGVVDVLKALVDAGADVDAQNGNGWTPLMNACYWCKPDAAAALIEMGARVDVANKENRISLHELCRSPFELYSCKEDEEAEVSGDDEDSSSARDGVKTIEDLRADHERRRARRARRLESRKSRESEMRGRREEELAEMACMLLEAGCDVNAQSQSYGEEDFTPLLYAAYHNHAEVALVLTQCEEQRVNLNYQGGDDQWTALHWAADRGNEEMVQLLLDAGADAWIRGSRYELASDRAGDESIKTLLLNAQNRTRDDADASDVFGAVANLRDSLPAIVTTTATPAEDSAPDIKVVGGDGAPSESETGDREDATELIEEIPEDSLVSR